MKKKMARKLYTAEFEDFWKQWKGRYDPDHGNYGGYRKVGKWTAFTEWQKLSKTDQGKATKVAHKAAGKYTPDAERWLKRYMFDDYD